MNIRKKGDFEDYRKPKMNWNVCSKLQKKKERWSECCRSFEQSVQPKLQSRWRMTMKCDCIFSYESELFRCYLTSSSSRNSIPPCLHASLNEGLSTDWGGWTVIYPQNAAEALIRWWGRWGVVSGVGNEAWAMLTKRFHGDKSLPGRALISDSAGSGAFCPFVLKKKGKNSWRMLRDTEGLVSRLIFSAEFRPRNVPDRIE